MPNERSEHARKDPAQEGAQGSQRSQRLFREAVLEAIEDGLDCSTDRGILEDLACKMGLDENARDRIIGGVLKDKGLVDKIKPEVDERPKAAPSNANKGRGVKEDMEEAQEVIDELTRELEEAHTTERALKARVAELEAKNRELLAQMGKAEIEPPPEGGSAAGPEAPQASPGQPPDDEFWGPSTGMQRTKERPVTAPIGPKPQEKPRPKTLPMPPKDEEPSQMRSVECMACGAKNTLESRLKGNVEFVCKGCGKRSYVNIGG